MEWRIITERLTGMPIQTRVAQPKPIGRRSSIATTGVQEATLSQADTTCFPFLKSRVTHRKLPQVLNDSASSFAKTAKLLEIGSSSVIKASSWEKAITQIRSLKLVGRSKSPAHASVTEELQRAYAHHSELEEKLKRSQEGAKEASQKVEQLSTDLAVASAKIEHAKRQVKKHAASSVKAEKHHAAHVKQLEQKHVKQVAVLRATIDEQQQTLRDRSELITDLRQQVNNRMSVMQLQQQKLQGYRNDIDEQKEKIAEHETVQSHLRMEVTALHNEVLRLTAELATARQSVRVEPTPQMVAVDNSDNQAATKDGLLCAPVSVPPTVGDVNATEEAAPELIERVGTPASPARLPRRPSDGSPAEQVEAVAAGSKQPSTPSASASSQVLPSQKVPSLKGYTTPTTLVKHEWIKDKWVIAAPADYGAVIDAVHKWGWLKPLLYTRDLKTAELNRSLRAFFASNSEAAERVEGDMFQLRMLSMDIEPLRKLVDLEFEIDILAHATWLFQKLVRMRRLLDRKILEHNNVWGNKLMNIEEFPGIIGDIPSEPFEFRHLSECPWLWMVCILVADIHHEHRGYDGTHKMLARALEVLLGQEMWAVIKDGRLIKFEHPVTGREITVSRDVDNVIKALGYRTGLPMIDAELNTDPVAPFEDWFNAFSVKKAQYTNTVLDLTPKEPEPGAAAIALASPIQ